MKNGILKFKNIVIENCSRQDFAYRDWMVKFHLEIVEKIAMELCDVYSGADRDLVKALVWFHDFGKPIDEKNEREITAKEGLKVMLECGYELDFVNKVVEYWNLMEKKNEIDLHTAPIEVQIVSSADGASHFTGVFHASYFRDDPSVPFANIQQELKEKIEKDWNRKIVLPEVKKAFQSRYEKAKELYGDLPDKFLE